MARERPPRSLRSRGGRSHIISNYSRCTLFEDALRHPHVDSYIRLIHQLCDRNIARHADELIGLMLREFPRIRKIVHHLLNCDPCRNGEIGICSHADEVGCRFRPGPIELHSLPYCELNAAAKRRFNCGLIDLTVALCGVTITNLE